MGIERRPSFLEHKIWKLVVPVWYNFWWTGVLYIVKKINGGKSQISSILMGVENLFIVHYKGR